MVWSQYIVVVSTLYSACSQFRTNVSNNFKIVKYHFVFTQCSALYILLFVFILLYYSAKLSKCNFQIQTLSFNKLNIKL